VVAEPIKNFGGLLNHTWSHQERSPSFEFGRKFGRAEPAREEGVQMEGRGTCASRSGAGSPAFDPFHWKEVTCPCIKYQALSANQRCWWPPLLLMQEQLLRRQYPGCSQSVWT